MITHLPDNLWEKAAFYSHLKSLGLNSEIEVEEIKLGIQFRVTAMNYIHLLRLMKISRTDF